MIPYSRTKLSDFFTLSQSKKPYPSQWHIPVYLYTDLPTPKRQKMPVSETRAGKSSVKSQADHPLLVGAVVDWNLSNDPLLLIEEIHMNNTVAVICSKMQNSKQIFQ